MKETLIAFTDDLMRQIILGKKIRTRRPMNPQPVDQDEIGWYYQVPTEVGGLIIEQRRYIVSPYGEIGDHLLCREALIKVTTHRSRHGSGAAFYERIAYRDTGTLVPKSQWTWKRDVLPARFMPRVLTRYAMPISVLRIERLQTIDEQEAQWEGVRPEKDGRGRLSFTVGFFNKWEALNGKRGAQYTWEANPWVWVVGWEAEDVYRYDQR